MTKRKRQLDQDQGEEEERAKRVRLCHYYENIEGQNDVASDSFDQAFDFDLLASNSLFIGELSEMHAKDSLKEDKETDEDAVDGKDKASSTCLHQSAEFLFSYRLEPEATRCIDKFEFPLIHCHQMEENISMSEKEVFEMDVVQCVWDAWQRKDIEGIDEILAAASEEILKNPLIPSQHQCVSCVYISKKMPEAFSLPKTYKVLLKLLSSGMTQPLKNKPNLSAIFASKLLHRAFVRELEWPIEFIQAFLGDVTGPHAWIEHDSCKDFVRILSSAFQDSIQSPNNRYASSEMRKMVQRHFFIILGKILRADSTRENSLVLLKLLMIGAEYEDARLIASSMLDRWINNPVYMNSAKDLLHCIVRKTCSMSKSDSSTVGNLSLLKIKNQHSNIYFEMVSQLLSKQREYAAIALKTLVLVELTAKDNFNLKNISTILISISFTTSPEHKLAMILQELTVDENTRTRLKEFVCRVVRHIGSYINIKALCQGLLQPWEAMVNQNESLKVVWLREIAELVTTILVHSSAAFAMDERIMLIISLLETSNSSISEAESSIAKTKKENLEALEGFSVDLAMLQLEAIQWCANVVVLYAPNINQNLFVNILKCFLFLGDTQSYFQIGEGIGEIECNLLQLLGSCTRASEEILAWIILLGISESYPLTMGDALSIVESLVWRAAAFHKLFRGSLHAESSQLPLGVIKLASFSLSGHPQESLTHLVYKDMYWRACMVLLLIGVFNPRTIGQYVWEKNSTVRQMMEMVITGNRKLCPFNDETAGKQKVSDPESEVITSDAKTKECKQITFTGEILPDTDEWRGKVTLLSSFGILERLPESIITELEEADRVYKLGHELRNCRSPDFLAQITSKQKLSKAWGWLRGILCQEPEIVKFLPFLWQCELLYLQEGLVAHGEKQFVDFKQLSLKVCNTIVDKSHQKEAKDFVEYLSCKLADKCSIIRRQAHRCFAHIFNTSSTVLSEESPSHDSGQRYLTPSNTCFDSFNFVRGDTIIKTARASNSANYDLRWLEGINAHPHAHTIISGLLPAVRNAVQVETSFEVLVIYLKFLEKYSPPFPSLLSFTCTIAKLLIQRKEFTAHLLSVACEDDSHVVYLSSSVTGKHMYMRDFIFNYLYEALRVGTSCQLNDEEDAGIKSPLVTLVAPQNDYGDTKCLHHITLHKIVLDAIILVLSTWSNRENYRKSENAIIENMIQVMTPNVTGKTSVAWLESSTGQRLPLLAEEQAIAFSRSKDDRIAFAGYNLLSLNSILELCQGLGVPSATVDFILEVLEMKVGFRLHEFLKPQKPTGGQSWTLQACLQTLSKFTTKHFQKLSWILSQISSANFFFTMPFIVHKSVIMTDSVAINGYEEKYEESSTADMVDLLVRQIAMSCLSFEHGFLSGVPDLILGYSELRKCIQRAVCCDNAFLLLGMMETSFKKFKVFEDHRFSWVNICFFLLPSLAVLTGSADGTLESLREFCTKKSQSETELEVWCEGLRKILYEMDTDLGNNLNVEKTILNTILHARFIIAEMQHLFEAQYAKPHSLCQKSLFKTMHVNHQESCSLLGSSYASFMGVEGSVRMFLELNLKQVWSENWHTYQSDIFISELLQFMLRITREGGAFLDCVGNLEADYSLGNKSHVMFSGCCGLFSGYLKFLDPCMNSHVWTSFQLLGDNGKDVFLGYSFMQLCLENIVHESSWQVMIKSLKSMVEYFGRVTPLSYFCNSQKSNPLTTNHLSACGFGKQPEEINMLEFLYLCGYHPRTVLVHQPSAQLENQGPGKRILMRRISTLLAHCIVNITSVACANIRIINTLQCSFKGKYSVDKVVCKDLVFLATLLLLFLASDSGDNLHAIVQQLLALDYDEKCDISTRQASSMDDAVSIAANELLHIFYFAFPFSVCSISQLDRSNVLSANKMLYGLKILQSSRLLPYRFRQAHPMYTLVQKALKAVCEGNEIESDKAYGFCHHLAKNHSLLVLPHILMVAALLKEKMADITHGKEHISSFGHALYLVAGLLDALRPHILFMHNNLKILNGISYCGLKDNTEEATLDVQKRHEVSKGALEVMMDVYFDVLNNLQAVNLPQYLKVVIRFTDFLCHCVAAGKHCLEVVAIRRTLIESTAQKFSKIKKLGFLLSLIDNHELSLHCQRTDTDDLLTQSYNEEITSEPPLLPVNVVQRVQSKLQHFLSLKTDEPDTYSSMIGRPGDILHRQTNSKNCEVEYEDELLSVLDDVEKASARLPMLLTSLEGILIELITVQNKNVQKHLYQLLERMLLHCPSKDSREKVMKAVLHNLNSSDISLAKMAAQQAVKFFHHCPELQETVLVELFLKRSVAKENLQQLLHDLLLFTT